MPGDVRKLSQRNHEVEPEAVSAGMLLKVKSPFYTYAIEGVEDTAGFALQGEEGLLVLGTARHISSRNLVGSQESAQPYKCFPAVVLRHDGTPSERFTIVTLETDEAVRNTLPRFTQQQGKASTVPLTELQKQFSISSLY